jgi:UDP-2,3-diacylglucosamine hydrolase
MTTYFVADLHLEESRPDIAQIFLKFLRQEVLRADALYILGDLFEAWIGDDDNTSFHQMIINALSDISRKGIPVYFMRGNRDFLVGKTFRRKTGCRLLPDEHVIQLYGQPTLLMHGDTLCTQDKEYLKFRRYARNYFVQKFFLFKSIEKRKAIAQMARQKSTQYTRSAPSEIMDVTPDEVIRVMKKYSTRHLIHGHTHRPDIHRFMIDDEMSTRTVLAPWHEKGSAFAVYANGQREFITLS